MSIELLEQIDTVLSKGDIKKADFEVDEEIFGRMLDFIGMLEPDQLTEDQVKELWYIIDSLEPYEDDPAEEEITEKRFLKKTSRAQRRKAKIYRRRHKTQIKAWRRKMKTKLKRAKKTGHGISGKKRGKTRRRAGPAS
jgi:hypothetical protein